MATWTSGMLNVLLSHLDANKGEDGLYMTNMNQALTSASHHISEIYPSHPVTNRQVSDRLRHLWNNDREKLGEGTKDDLYREGRDILNIHCGEANLKAREKKGLYGLHGLIHRSKDRRRPKSRIKRDRGTSSPRIKRDVDSQSESLSLSSSTSINSGTRTRTRSRGHTTPEEPVFIDSHRTFAQTLGAASSKAASEEASSSRNPTSYLRHTETPDPLRLPSFDINSDTQSLTPIQCEIHDMQQKVDVIPLAKPRMFRLEKISDFLLIDPNVFLPSRENLDHRHGETMSCIRDAALQYLETTGVDDRAALEIYPCHSSTSFFDICKRLYNVISKERLLEEYAKLQLESPLSPTDFIRALMAAAITEWIFQGRHDPLPTPLAWTSSPAKMYEDIIAGLSPELHEQVLRKRNHEYVKNKADLDVFLPGLTSRFVHALIPFIRCNMRAMHSESDILPANEHNIANWHDVVSKAFRKALELHARVSLLGLEYAYEWPRNGDDFDRNSMVTESNYPKKNGKVHVMLFPALMRTSTAPVQDMAGGDSLQKTYIFKAHVILR